MRTCMLKMFSGSHLYGLNTENSDTDYVGIFLPTKKQMFSLSYDSEVDMSVEDRLDNGKNSPNAIDVKFYDIKRFISLAMEGNPNVIEKLFVNEESILHINKYGRMLLDNKDLFLSKKIISKHLGYSRSQRRKLIIKTANMENLINARDFLQEKHNNGFEKNLLPEFNSDDNFNKIFIEDEKKKIMYKVGAYSINRNITIKSALRWINELISNTSHRLENLSISGYEHKFASHSLRLLYQTIEIIETGKITFPLKERDYILKVKKGLVPYEELISKMEELELKLSAIENNTLLPDVPDINKINLFLNDIFTEWFKDNESNDWQKN